VKIKPADLADSLYSPLQEKLSIRRAQIVNSMISFMKGKIKTGFEDRLSKKNIIEGIKNLDGNAIFHPFNTSVRSG